MGKSINFKRGTGMKVICVYCQRPADVIVGFVVNKQKSNHKTQAGILFIDSQNRLCCGRCIAEYDLVLNYRGEAVIVNNVKKNTYSVNSKALEKSVKTPVTLERDETVRDLEL
jgi:hypothetical protein